MSDTRSSGPSAAASSDDRVLAFFGYAMLALAPITGGASTILTLVICLLRKAKADALNGAHFRYQLRLFWIPVIALGACAVLGIIGAMGLGVYAVAPGMLLVIGASLYSAVMAIVGIVRLNENKPIGKGLPAPAPSA